MTNWNSLRAELNLTKEEEQMIEFEKNLIRTMIAIREEKGITQKQLADLCGVKQSFIGRLERAIHSPQINSLLRVLVPLGYTLQIVPLKNGKYHENTMGKME